MFSSGSLRPEITESKLQVSGSQEDFHTLKFKE